MPTGYTADVQDGTITELKPFAMACARAFGALITMREDPKDAPIPDEFKPDEYYSQRLMSLGDEARRLESMTIKECIAAQNNEIANRRQACDSYVAEREIHNRRYASMLEKVTAWEPPSSEHQGLKQFMIEQLELSKHDSNWKPDVPHVQDPGTWRTMKLATLKDQIESAKKYLAEEADRAQKRAVWVRQLKAAL